MCVSLHQLFASCLFVFMSFISCLFLYYGLFFKNFTYKIWEFLSRRAGWELHKLEIKIISINSLKNITFVPIKWHSWRLAPVYWNILLIAIQKKRFLWKIILNVFKITECNEGIINQFWFLMLIFVGKIVDATRMVFAAFFFVWASVLAEIWHILGLSSESIKRILDRSW